MITPDGCETQYLLNGLGVDENRYVLQFIRNLTVPVIREAIRARPIAIAEDEMKSVAGHAIRMKETDTEEKSSVSSAQRVKQCNSGTTISSTTANFSNKSWTRQIEDAKAATSEASISNCPMCAGRHRIDQCTATEYLFCKRRMNANKEGLKTEVGGKA